MPKEYIEGVRKYKAVFDPKGTYIGSRIVYNQKVAVLAGNYREFCQFLDENGGTDTEYVYADERIIGYRLQDYKIYGTFWERKNADKIIDMVKSRIAPYPKSEKCQMVKNSSYWEELLPEPKDNEIWVRVE